MKSFLVHKFHYNILWLFILSALNSEASSIVLFNFKAQNVPVGKVKEFSTSLRIKLGETIMLLSEREMKNILESKEKRLEKYSEEDSIIELGKLLNAREIILGTVLKANSESYTFNITLIYFKGNMDYGKKEAQVVVNSENLLKCVDEVSEKIAKELPEYFLTGKIIKMEKDDVYVSPGKMKLKEEMLLNVFHPKDTVVSKGKKTSYKETGTLMVKKVFGDTLAITNSIGKVQLGDVVAIEASWLGEGQYARVATMPVLIKKGTSCSFPDVIPSINGKFIQGVVLLEVIIDTMGNVSDVKVKKSLHPAYDSCAIADVKQWKFSPAKQDNKPVRFSIGIPVRFTVPSQNK